MLPREWSLRLVDTNVAPLADDAIAAADWVLLSGMIVHRESAHEIARRCANLGKPVIAGGPLFTSCPEEFPEIPHLALGEAEELMPRIVADMQGNCVQAIYRAAGFVDLARTPLPRWDLIDLRHSSRCRCSSRAAARSTASSATSWRCTGARRAPSSRSR